MKSLIRKEILDQGATYETRILVLGICIFSRSIPFRITTAAPHLL